MGGILPQQLEFILVAFCWLGIGKLKYLPKIKIPEFNCCKYQL